MQNKRIARRGLRRCVLCRGSTQLQHTGHLGITAIYSIRPRSRWCGGGGAAVRGGGGRKAHVVPSMFRRLQAKKTHLGLATRACFSRRNTTESRRFGTSSSSSSSRAAHSSKQGRPFVRVFHGRLPVRANSAWEVSPVCVLSHLNMKKRRLVGEQSERE